jgi:GNAT superfamily N-acetyltransferase
MVTLLRTDSKHIDFITLVKKLDQELAQRDGDDHAFYDQFNKIDLIRHALVVYDQDIPVACGAIKEFAPGMMEIKRMYTLPDYRGKGIATKILSALEKWSLELSYEKCILETGKKQPEAISLYRKNNYKVIPNYGQYAGVDNSVCFEKTLVKIEL